jgi:hypothetical protein
VFAENVARPRHSYGRKVYGCQAGRHLRQLMSELTKTAAKIQRARCVVGARQVRNAPVP